MKVFCAIISVFFLLNLNAFAQIPSDANLLLQVGKISETNFSGNISNTQPDVQYEIQRRQGKTNWVSLGFVFGSETANWTVFDFRSTNTVNSKMILRIRSWIDDGSGIPDWWQLRYFGNVGVDPYGNPEGDGWNNMQKFQMGVDPFQWHQPAAPQNVGLTFRAGKDVLHENAVLSWENYNGPTPDFFIIERANRALRRMTNNVPPFRRGANGRILTNRPPVFRPSYGGRPGWPPQEPFVTSPYEVVAKVPGQPNIREYHYTDTNINAFSPPAYRIQAHFQEPASFAEIKTVSTKIVRKTILSVTAKQGTNGYALTVLHPALHVRYLLLVRGKNDRQWRASGYFVSGTNGNPVHLQVDKMGMMTDPQSPISLPAVKFLPDVVQPEFIAGYGEDSDGDLLPDIYEVLVTHTNPANDDTGDTGVIDGFKKMTSDGLSNFEKFRCRVDPLHPAKPPPTVELIHPTASEIEKAVTPKSDLHCEPQIEVRTNGAISYQPVEKVPWMVGKILNFRESNEPRNFDLRVSWQFSEMQPHNPGSFAVPPQYEAIESLVEKTSVQLFEIFSNNLATNPPVSRNDMTKITATIERAYRAGEMDKGLIMEEMMLLEDSQPQYFYGKVIDQNGQPVVGAEVTLQVSLDFGRGGTYKTNADAGGCFQFTGLRGKSLSITAEKKGYQNAGQGLGLKGPGGTDSSTDNRASYVMWKLKGPEPMIHKEISSRKIQPDGRIYMIDFLKDEITEGTNAAGDMLVQIQRPPQVKPRGKYDWSFVMTAIDGGFIEVTNDNYLNEAPEGGYLPQYQMNRYATNVVNYSTYSLYRTDRTFFLKSRGGQIYGHFHINELDPDYRGMAALQIEYYINPSGSRNLEFDPAKQIQ